MLGGGDLVEIGQTLVRAGPTRPEKAHLNSPRVPSQKVTTVFQPRHYAGSVVASRLVSGAKEQTGIPTPPQRLRSYSHVFYFGDGQFGAVVDADAALHVKTGRVYTICATPVSTVVRSGKRVRKSMKGQKQRRKFVLDVGLRLRVMARWRPLCCELVDPSCSPDVPGVVAALTGVRSLVVWQTHPLKAAQSALSVGTGTGEVPHALPFL